MGNSCSRDDAIVVTDVNERPVAPKVEDDSALKEASAQARQLNEEEWMGSKRIGFGQFLKLAKDMQSAERHFLVCTMAPPIYSAEVEAFEPWCSFNAGNGGAVACTMSPSNVNFGATMLRGMMEVSERIASAAADGTMTPNAPVREDQLINVLRYKDIWKRLLDASAVQSYNHPALGRVATVQPIILNCIQTRLGLEGYGEDGVSLQPVFHLLLDHGASGRVRSNFGLTPLMLLASAAAGSSGSHRALFIPHCLALARLLLAAGADPAATARPLGAGWRLGAHSTGLLYDIEGLLQGSTPFTALDVLDHVAAREAAEQAADDQQQQQRQQHLGELRALLQPQADQAAGAGQQQQQQQIDQAAHGPVPWTQAIFNIIWAASQVTLVAGPRQRCAVLEEVRRDSPFNIPSFMMVPVPELRKLGYIPRYSTRDVAGSARHGGGTWKPVPVSELPPGSVTVFLSHRWLGNGCPDDENGTKLRQALLVAEFVAEKHKIPVELVYLWIDYSVVDQSDPMPGVQALPIYIACCDEFVYVHHDQYWERAWCLTEQYMYWKLCRGRPKHCLRPGPAPGATGGVSHQQAHLVSEPNDAQPPDPALGKLFAEADRVALATLTSIMPEEGE